MLGSHGIVVKCTAAMMEDSHFHFKTSCFKCTNNWNFRNTQVLFFSSKACENQDYNYDIKLVKSTSVLHSFKTILINNDFLSDKDYKCSRVVFIDQ